jgi:formylglycine-generating enzyme required for sulfatase activity
MKDSTNPVYKKDKQDKEEGGSYRVYRGGCWIFDASYARVSIRYSYIPSNRFYNQGFRLVKNRSKTVRKK